jgi:hypothetical protein
LTGRVTDGVARNERLTGTTAVVLLVLLAVEGRDGGFHWFEREATPAHVGALS